MKEFRDLSPKIIAHEILPFKYLSFTWFYFKNDKYRKLYQVISYKDHYILHRNIKSFKTCLQESLFKKMKYESLYLYGFGTSKLDNHILYYKKTLRNLCIQDTYICFDTLSKLDNLEILKIGGYSCFTNKLYKLQKLKTLSINRTSYSNCIDHFRHLKHIRCLEISLFNRNIDYKFIKDMDKLEILKLYYPVYIDPLILSYSPKKLRKIYFIGSHIRIKDIKNIEKSKIEIIWNK